MGVEYLASHQSLIKITELGLPEMHANIERGHEGTVNIKGFTIRISVHRSFWQQLPTHLNSPPYCIQSVNDWGAIAYSRAFIRDTCIEQVPLYKVFSDGDQIETMLYIDTIPIFFKRIGTYHTGMAVISYEGRLMCFKVSPMVIGIAGYNLVFDHRRYDVPQEKAPRKGIALLGEETSLELDTKRSLHALLSKVTGEIDLDICEMLALQTYTLVERI